MRLKCELTKRRSREACTVFIVPTVCRRIKTAMAGRIQAVYRLVPWIETPTNSLNQRSSDLVWPGSIIRQLPSPAPANVLWQGSPGSWDDNHQALLYPVPYYPIHFVPLLDFSRFTHFALHTKQQLFDAALLRAASIHGQTTARLRSKYRRA